MVSFYFTENCLPSIYTKKIKCFLVYLCSGFSPQAIRNIRLFFSVYQESLSSIEPIKSHQSQQKLKVERVLIIFFLHLHFCTLKCPVNNFTNMLVSWRTFFGALHDLVQQLGAAGIYISIMTWKPIWKYFFLTVDMFVLSRLQNPLCRD